MNEQYARGVYYCFQNGRKNDIWIIDPDGNLIDTVTSERLGQSICDELNSIAKPTPEQLDALIAILERHNGGAFGARRWAEERGMKNETGN